jgi:hypothetical protein
MENKLLSFSEFESLYESYGFVNETETAEKPEFTPTKTDVSIDDLLSIFNSKPENEAGETPAAFTVIKKGENSDRVKELQKTLGMGDLGKMNGVFGDGTDAKVREFQTKNKLTVDGKVGVQTLTKMLQLKGEKDPATIIKTKYIIKNSGDAKTAGIDPELLKIYDITIVNNGVKQYVICVPKANAAAKIKELDGKGKLKGALAWMKLGLSAMGKAFCLTAAGAVLLTLETAKAMISSVASGAKFVAGGVAYVIGAAVQGIALAGKWVAAKGAAIYAKATNLANELWKAFATGFANVCKSSIQGLTAFLKGAAAVGKTIGLTLTGIAVTAWKGVANIFTPAIKTLVQNAKDGAAFITGGMDWIAKNVKTGVIQFKNDVVAGWNTVKTGTVNAYNSAKKALSSSAKSVQDAAKSAYDATTSFFTSMYDEGKKAWESEIAELGLPVFESQELEFDFIDFSVE